MTLQRQYTLPNCNLKLEGLSTGEETDPMAPLTVVLNSECTFPGTSETLSGGREFLDALVKTVSDYAQSLLSGIPYPTASSLSETMPVMLQPSENHRYHLVADVTDANGETVRKSLELNTVQLFDLMEAVDQLLTDTLTLPDMSLQLTPLHRRHARLTEPIAKRAVPVAAGLSALAASAALLFVLPVPQFEPQRTNEEQRSAAVMEEETSTAPNPEAPIATDEDGETAATGEMASSEPSDPVAAATALTRLSTAPEITDPDTLEQLEDDLETTLAEALPEDISFDESLVYRVALSEEGDVLGYKYENEAALSNVDSTPLPDLTFISPNPDEAVEEPIAQFRVTFDPDGGVTAEPLSETGEESE